MTPQRAFRDDDKRRWNAWDVIPSWGERRWTERRQRAASPPAHTGERRRAERRRVRGIRVSLTPRLAHGGLAFECADERRRMAPIPDGWHLLPDPELRDLWREAERLPPRRKRLVE